MIFCRNDFERFWTPLYFIFVEVQFPVKQGYYCMFTKNSVSAGDMRRSITYLQSLHRLNADEITPADVLDVAAMCDDDRVRSIIQAAHQISFDKLIQKVKDLLLVSSAKFDSKVSIPSLSYSGHSK